ncbi:MAG: non-heme iron oxygenase ferredoxin subunit [Chloroflexi bacterium]|nr:non-heme iron oxygenase ferredoxin subunit [Chloroflexota bacterium]MBI4507419.1 non-heme iron oxygenase ferredoxin subunit [Chloroflexota bacterium]
MPEWTSVARLADVPDGQAITVQVGKKRLALARADGTVYAIDDVCTHDGGPLGEGYVDGYDLECPRHGATFDVRTGRPTRLPAVAPVKTHRVRVEGDEIQVAV